MALEEDENLYVKADLEDFADFSNVVHGGGFTPPSRSEMLKDALGLSDVEMSVVSSGGYQGTMLFVFRTGGYLWLVKDSYGSCSYCDGRLACDDTEETRNYARSMCRNGYAFEDPDNARQFLREKAGHGKEMSTFAYGWGPLVEEGLDAIDRQA